MQPKQMEDKTTAKDQLQAVWFAAGMAVFIACLERAAVMSVFRHWHMWVFLALNLLLIAILFTSTHPSHKSSSPSLKSSDSGQYSDKTQPSAVVEVDHREDVVDEGVNAIDQEKEESRRVEKGEEADDVKSSNLLSNEELNERVEAFISRFRQQYLVSDVRISKSRSENVCRCGLSSKTITV